MDMLVTKQLSESQQEFCRPATNKDFVSEGVLKYPTDVPMAAKWVKREREKRNWSTNDLADRARAIAAEEGDQIKLAQQLISAFEQPGRAKRPPSWLRYVARAFEEDAEGTVRLPDKVEVGGMLEFVGVDALPSYAGMGGGGSGEGDLEMVPLPRRLIVDQLRGQPSDFLLLDVRGDSMEPDFHHGDQILIDKRDRDPRQPGAFALWDDDGYVVKLVERVPQKNGWYRIFSSNPRYSSYEIEATETNIMGRPVWFARQL